jgi:hypothetical protein
VAGNTQGLELHRFQRRKASPAQISYTCELLQMLGPSPDLSNSLFLLPLVAVYQRLAGQRISSPTFSRDEPRCTDAAWQARRPPRSFQHATMSFGRRCASALPGRAPTVRRRAGRACWCNVPTGRARTTDGGDLVRTTIVIGSRSQTGVNPAGASFVLSSLAPSPCVKPLHALAVRMRRIASRHVSHQTLSSRATCSAGTDGAGKSPTPKFLPGLVQPTQ